MNAGNNNEVDGAAAEQAEAAAQGANNAGEGGGQLSRGFHWFFISSAMDAGMFQQSGDRVDENNNMMEE